MVPYLKQSLAALSNRVRAKSELLALVNIVTEAVCAARKQHVKGSKV